MKQGPDWHKISQEDYWAYLNRFFSFEPPADRVLKLRQALSRAAGKTAKAVARLPVAQQDSLWHGIYGQVIDPAQISLAILLALEDIERYKPKAFEEWILELVDYAPKADLEHLSASEATPKNVNALAKAIGFPDPKEALVISVSLACHFAMNNAQALWLLRSTMLCPDFSLLSGQGPWQNDARAVFICDFLQQQEVQLIPKTVPDWLVLQKTFRSALQLWKEKKSIIPAHFLPAAVVLVEGQTENILLPYLCECLDFSLDRHSIVVLPAGGSNQVLRRYIKLKEILNLPMVILLDADAGEQSRMLHAQLRQGDRLHDLVEGEIEDVFEARDLVCWVNEHLLDNRLHQPITLQDLDIKERRTEALDKLWRLRGMGDFDKLALAQAITANRLAADKVPAEIKELVESLKVLTGKKLAGR